MKLFYVLFLVFFTLTGCHDYPSTQELETDITALKEDIKNAENDAQMYSGGLISLLINIRLETLKSTQSMLDQKNKGIQRFIPLSYTINGNEYIPPSNKVKLLKELNEEIEKLQKELSKAEEESTNYSGGLLAMLAFTKVETTRSTLAFLRQKQLLLKYDIPYYSLSPAPSSGNTAFKKTPGKDIDKF